MKRMTIAIEEEAYNDLCHLAPPRKRGKLISQLIKEKKLKRELEKDYAEMAKDEEHEKEALEWCEIGIPDIKIS